MYRSALRSEYSIERLRRTRLITTRTSHRRNQRTLKNYRKERSRRCALSSKKQTNGKGCGRAEPRRRWPRPHRSWHCNVLYTLIKDGALGNGGGAGKRSEKHAGPRFGVNVRDRAIHSKNRQKERDPGNSTAERQRGRGLRN